MTGQTYEVGFRGTLPNFYDGGLVNYKIGAFRTDLANDILQLATPGNAARGYFINVPATRRQGIEVGAEYVSDWLSVYANYALIDATFQFNGTLSSPNNPLSDDGAISVTPGNKVPLIPAHQFKVGFDVEVLPRWRVGLALQAYSSSYYRGDESNLNPKLPPYYVLSLNTSYRVDPNLELFGYVTNLTNNRYATFGTFCERGAVAGNFVDQRPAHDDAGPATLDLRRHPLHLRRGPCADAGAPGAEVLALPTPPSAGSVTLNPRVRGAAGAICQVSGDRIPDI